MNACIFVVAINMIMPVFGNDRSTQTGQLGPGDKVCILEIDGDWMAAHWSNGARGHGGWLHHLHVARPAEPTEPAYREE